MSSASFSSKKVCVAGATSTVARKVAQRLAGRGAILHLGAREVEEAGRIGQDIQVRQGGSVTWSRFEATDPESREALFEEAEREMKGLDVLFVAVGMLGDQRRAQRAPTHLGDVIEVNYAAVVQLLTRAAQRFESRGKGQIVALSSVAGDRGRSSNYAYGSAKAGLTAFLEGLRGRLYGSGVHVLTVKPGPTDTKMTFGMDEPPPLMAEPERVASDIVAAMESRIDICYTPPIWRYIMMAIRLIPSSVFKKLDL